MTSYQLSSALEINKLNKNYFIFNNPLWWCIKGKTAMYGLNCNYTEVFILFFKVPHCQLKIKVKLANTSDMLMALETKPMLSSAGGDIWQLQHWSLSSNKVTFVALPLPYTLTLHGLLVKCAAF